MSPHRRPVLSYDALLLKYQELMRKHQTLVHKLEARTEEHISTWTLSSWGLETAASGLALFQGDGLRLSNKRWRQLADAPGYWRAQDESLAPMSMHQVAQHEVRRVLATGGAAPLTTHYTRGDTQVVELRAEWLAGQPHARVLVMALDITERVRAEEELRQVRQELLQREHLRALGELVSGIAHDLNNTLNAMTLRLELMQSDRAFAERQRGNMDALVRIVTDANKRLGHLRDFSRQQPEQAPTEDVQLADVAHEAVEIARADIEHRAAQEGLRLRVRQDMSPLPLVRGSASDLRYVVINLLLNARDAMPRGGTIHVRGGQSETQAWLTVEDEGTGIPEEHLPKLFRPFFTTKGKHGTGLGLSMAYGVLTRAGGTLTATNRPEGGARFTLSLPITGPSAAPPKPTPVRRPRAAKRARKR
ncbi:sensor histidine kinase [Archangium primigenium]|uniref:sensor histidine kinase n=1 Tax=[Archangium] primigenium TaxID=2792470 RepID=UPI001959319C|nr:ATP-binding protein [Archangium primigenium]MBM7119363.1 sensor histidine kinase [Archangium primigenium]